MKRIIALTIICSAALLGCGKKNEPSPAPVTETSVSVEEVAIESVVADETTEKSVIKGNADKQKDSEFWFDFLPEQSGEDVCFSDGDNEFTEAIDISDCAYSLVVDLDNDGINEAFVCDVSEIDESSILVDVLYFVDENKVVSVLNEGYTNIYIKQKMLQRESGRYVTINGYEGVESFGDVYSYVDDCLVNITGNLSKYGAKLFVNDEIVWCKTGYMGFCQVDDEQSEPLWSGRTYIPYYYKLEDNQLILYSSEGLTLDDINHLGDFNDEVYSDAESVQYLYCENGDLRVNYVIKEEFKDCILYTFECDVYSLENETWVYQYWTKGYYQSDPIDYTVDEWEFFLTQ